MSHSIEWRCPQCQRPSGQELDDATGLTCESCGHTQSFADGSASDTGIHEPLEACVCCGYERLFAQKDFNRKLGLAIVIVGAVLAPWTYGLSLLVFMGIDYGLYRFVPEITVCYGCDAIHRGFEHNPIHRAHDPLLADRYKRESPANIAAEGVAGTQS